VALLVVGAGSVPANHELCNWSDDCTVPDSHYLVWYDELAFTGASCMNSRLRVEFCVVFGSVGKKLRDFIVQTSRRGGNALAKPVSSLARLHDRMPRRKTAGQLDLCYNGGMMMNMPD